jgi:hypothetical protein
MDVYQKTSKQQKSMNATKGIQAAMKAKRAVAEVSSNLSS